MRWIVAGIFVTTAADALAVAADLSFTQALSSNASAAVTVVNSNPTLTNLPSVSPAPASPAEKKKDPFDVAHTAWTALVSAVTALITGWFSERKKRQENLRQEFQNSIRLLRSTSEEIGTLVQSHLTPDRFSVTKQKASQVTILAKLKLVSGRVQSAAAFLHAHESEGFEKEFLQWKGELTGSPFPVTQKDSVCKLHDAAVVKVQNASEKWGQYLDGIVRNCMSGKLDVPLKPKAKKSNGS
jgi:hypothetical protein